MSRPLLLGKLKIDVSEVDDHFSLMEHFRRKVKRHWGIKDDEFWDMLQEFMMYCPKKYKWPR